MSDYDMSIHTNPDAAAWTKFFRETYPDCNVSDDVMHGWFANAMMAMYDNKEKLKFERDCLLRVITELKDLLAQPEQEPVAWMSKFKNGGLTDDSYYANHKDYAPLYPVPPKLTPRQGLEEYKKGYLLAEQHLKREPLSDETIAELWGEEYSGKTDMVKNFARAIEKAHGIGVVDE